MTTRERLQALQDVQRRLWDLMTEDEQQCWITSTTSVEELDYHRGPGPFTPYTHDT